MDNAELLKHATEFVFTPTREEGEEEVEALRHFRVYVKWRSEGKYSVSYFNDVWNGQEWEYEPLPSSRDDDFLKRTRFSLDKAVGIASALPDTLVMNGRTYREWYELQRTNKKK